jgi:hypothetical protein
LFAKQKDADAQRLAKKISVQFYQQNLSPICLLKFAKCRLPFTQLVRQKSFSYCLQTSLLFAKKSLEGRGYVDEIDPCRQFHQHFMCACFV